VQQHLRGQQLVHNLHRLLQGGKPMTEEIFVVIVSLASILFTAFLIFLLREEHSLEIYVIWYIFSFAFLLFFGLHMVAERAHIELPEIFGPRGKDVFKAAYGWLTNTDDEWMLVVAILGLGIGPQLLTYILCSLSGSASPPRFVWQIESVAAWSLIKFCAALTGILAAEQLARWIAGEAFQDKLQLVRPTAGLGFTFGLAYAQLIFVKGWSRIDVGHWLDKVHRFSTRSRKEKE
jgi:hypothetical protein